MTRTSAGREAKREGAHGEFSRDNDEAGDGLSIAERRRAARLAARKAEQASAEGASATSEVSAEPVATEEEEN